MRSYATPRSEKLRAHRELAPSAVHNLRGPLCFLQLLVLDKPQGNRLFAPRRVGSFCALQFRVKFESANDEPTNLVVEVGFALSVCFRDLDTCLRIGIRAELQCKCFKLLAVAGHSAVVGDL